MKRILLSFILLVTFASTGLGGEELLIPELFDRFDATYTRVDGQGNIWTGYHDQKGEFHIRDLTSKKDIIVSTGKGTASRGFTFEMQGDRAYIAWRDKIDGKKMYFRVVSDGGKTVSDPILLDNNKTEALPRIEIGSNSKGIVAVLWYGEKTVNKEKYHYYMATSNDFGKTFSEPINLTAGYSMAIYPTLLVDEENIYIYSYAHKGDKRYMIFRKSPDGGKTWTDPLEIKELAGAVTNYITSIKAAGRLHVFWYLTTDTLPLIEGAYSDDDGKTWKTRAFEDTRGISTNYFTVAVSNGHIYLAFSGNRRAEKSSVYLMTSEDNGSSWGRRITLRHYPFEKTMALFPKVISTDDGRVVVVWVDYRNIRSNVYMQYSNDFGKTWQEKDSALEEPGRYNTYYNAPASENFIKLKDRYYLLAFRFMDDLISSGEANLLLLDFGLNQRGVK